MSDPWVITKHQKCWEEGQPIAIADSEEAADAYILQNKEEWKKDWPHGCLEATQVPNITTNALAFAETASETPHTPPT